jgi:hypothetical protein
MPEPLTIHIEDDEDETVTVDSETGAISTRQPDGGEIVELHPRPKSQDGDEDKFFRNLADEIDGMELGKLAIELHEAISADESSRDGYLANVARGLDFMGLELKEPKSGVADGSGAVEGMSSVTNPLLLEAVLKGWANSVGEFLPANGPVKVKNDGEESAVEDDLAETLERDMNHYLTIGAPEYYPETSHMLLWGTYFSGSGFKKVYRCPIKRRPTAPTVDAKDLIVSDTTKDLKSCERVTHRIFMRPSVMKRMQFIGAYRKVDLTQPTPQPNQIDEKTASMQGTRATPERQEDQPYELWECQCELDLPEFAENTQFKGEGIPLPYLVTLEKDSQQILAIRRDWNEDDEDCQRRQMYVKYPYIPGPGFYGTGLLNVLGNSSAAMTAAWREALDAGMFASFPGGLMAKSAARQNSSIFRVAPGEFKEVETQGLPINQVVMGMPYKDATPGLMSMIDRIETQTQRLGGSVDIPTQEGIQNVPVGTMLAHIEQVTKIMLATHKGMHQAQSEEIKLHVELFREHPEDFFRGLDKEQRGYWDEQKLLQALEDVALVPVSDPNTPSHIHRIAKALGLVELSAHPVLGPRLDPDEILRRVLAAMREDPQGLIVQAPPQQMPPDLAGAAKMMDAQTKKEALGLKAQEIQQKGSLEQVKQAGEEKIENIRLQREEVIHRADAARADREQQMDAAKAGAEMQMQREGHQQEMHLEHAKHGLAVEAQEHQQGLAEQQQQHSQGLAEASHAVEAHTALNPPEKKDSKT